MARLTKNHIKKVGDTLIDDHSSDAAREEALADLSRWREAHLVPFQEMLEALERAARNAGADFVLFGRIKRIDYETQEAHIRAFPQTAARDAVMKYAEDEQSKRQSGRTDALMLKASSLDTLKRALPNYFSGVSPFLGLISSYLR